MIERKFVAQNIKELQIQEFILKEIKKAGISHIKMQRTPLGEKIIVHASRPGLVVGRKGQSIKELTKSLKKKFDLENPQIELSDVENVETNAHIVAEKIANSLERFGISKFKGIGHKSMEEVMKAGALGIEIIMSGKIPSARAKRWRFYQGYLKKSGEISITGVDKAYAEAQLKTGTVGIQVRIMPDIKLPDHIQLKEAKEEVHETKVEDKINATVLPAESEKGD